MDPTKKTSGAITIKIVKLANKQIDGNLKNCINDCIKQNQFPNGLKRADIKPTFKKGPLDKTNYRPIGILPTVSMFLSCHVRVSELIHTLQLPEYQGTPCSMQARNVKFK